MVKIIKEIEITQGEYIGFDRLGRLYYSDYFNSNNNNRNWEKVLPKKKV